MDDLNSDEDYYIDDETGKHMTTEEIIDKDKEAFEELHRLLYGNGTSRGMFSSRLGAGSKKKRPAHDSGSDTEDEEPPRKAKKARPAEKKKEEAAPPKKSRTKSREKKKVTSPSRTVSRAKKAASRSKEPTRDDDL
jgi:hypothetical protein